MPESGWRMALPEIPDELMADIFLRLPTAADLIRASAACVSFRLLVADRSFLRRFRKLHAPPLLGFLDYHFFHPAVAPHPSAPAASAVAIAADFTFAFLPQPAWIWSVRDVRDGRVLLDRPRLHDEDKGRGNLFKEIVVCDPLYRQYVLLPPIPEDLTASVENPLPTYGRRWGEIFLVPPGDDDEADASEETSFRVIWMVQCEIKPVAFMFCSSTGQWRAIPSLNWSDLVPGIISFTWTTVFLWRQYAYGCFYWAAGWSEQFLVLDTRRMEFSMADRPPEARGSCDRFSMAIVEAGEGMLGIFVHGLGRSADEIFGLSAHNTFGLRYTIRRNNGGGSTQWQMEKTISMGSGSSFMGSTGRHLLLYQCGSSSLDTGCFMLDQYGSSSLDAGCFTLDLKTFRLERVCASGPIPKSHAYCNFPPSILSSPTVSSGFGETGRQVSRIDHAGLGADGVQVTRHSQEPTGPSHGLLLQGIGYMLQAPRCADHGGATDVVPAPELQETGPGGVQGPVLAAAAQVPNPLFVVGNDAKQGF